ncbi:MAG: DUF3078 domain-containing protein [Bacteroidia bacterium]
MVADSAKADTTYWKRGGVFGVNFSQATFTNWAAGGVDAISGQALLNIYANYKKGTTTWDNVLDMAYGSVKQNGYLARKSDDKIDFTSKYGHYAFKKVWYYTALFNFKSQFFPGYNYVNDTTKTLISDWLAPGYTLLAVGLDYKPNTKFTAFFSPFTGKTTLVYRQDLANQGAFGVKKAEFDAAGNVVKKGENIRNEFGGYIRLQYRADIMKNVNLATKLELFSNYLDRPQNFDVNAEALLTMKVNKFISASVNLQGIYDNDINIAVDKNKDGVIDANGPRLQFRQVIGVGFSAKF